MIGISRWQWGHQWAMKITTLGLPSLVRTTGSPANDLPVTVGGALLTAGSAAFGLLGMSGSAGPSTVTGCVSEKPAAALLAVGAESSFDLPPMLATTAMTPITTTTPITMAKMGSFDACLGGGLPWRGDLGGVLVAIGPPLGGEQYEKERERRRRHRRDGEVAEPLHPLQRARVGRVARPRFQVRVPLDEDVVRRDDDADPGEQRGVGADPVVAAEHGQAQYRDERVHADPLIPAQLAGDEVGALREPQAAGHRDGGHQQGEGERLRADGVDDDRPPAGDGEHEDDDDGDLGHDREQGKEEGAGVGRHGRGAPWYWRSPLLLARPIRPYRPAKSG